MGSLVLTTEALEPLSIHGWVSIPDAQDDVAEWTTGVLATALQFYSSTYIFKLTKHSDKLFIF